MKLPNCDSFVFLSVDPWQEERWARKQMFAYHLAQRGAKVVYFTESRQSLRKWPLIHRKHERLYLVDVPLIGPCRLHGRLAPPCEKAAELILLAVLWKLRIRRATFLAYQPQNVRLSLRIARYIGKTLLCYDYTDDWSEFFRKNAHEKNRVLEDDKWALTAADIVFAVSAKLFEKARQFNPNSYLLPNATSFENFHKAMLPGPIAADIGGIGQPLIGYVGKITTWRIDFDLLRYIAENRPNWSFVMIGPFNPDVHEMVAQFDDLANISFIGPREYWKLADYMRAFSACILPHKTDNLTEAMDPIKLYDYLATGKPIVATAVREADKFRGVIEVCDGQAAFLAALDRVVNEPEADVDRERRLSLARANSWEQRVDELITIMNKSTCGANRTSG